MTGYRPYKAIFGVGSGGNICFAYDSASDMKLRRSSDYGASWSPADTLARWSSNGLLSANVDGFVQFIWEDNDTLYCRRSTNSGVDWSGRMPLRAVESSSELRFLVTNRAPYAYLAFESGDSLLVSRTTDNGAHWDAAQSVVVAAGIGYAYGDVDNQGRVHIVWSDDHTGNYEVYYVRSVDNGTTWSSTTRFTVSNGSTPYWLDAKDANVFVSYLNLTTLKTRRRSFDGGATWEDESKWPGSNFAPPGDLYTFACLGEGNWLHLVSLGYEGGSCIQYYRSKNAGTNWQDSAVTISDADPLNRYARAIATSGSDVHILWEDYKYGNYEIMYRRGVGLAGMEERAQDLAPQPALALSVNPSLFSRGTALSYTLAGAADVSVTILDISGRLVWSAPIGTQEAGGHALRWNGEDASGVSVPAGCYFCVLKAGSRTTSSKMLLTR